MKSGTFTEMQNGGNALRSPSPFLSSHHFINLTYLIKNQVEMLKKAVLYVSPGAQRRRLDRMYTSEMEFKAMQLER